MRGRDKHLVSLGAQDCDCQSYGLLSPIGAEDLARPIRETVVTLQLGADCLTQLGHACILRVAREPFVDSLDAGLGDGGRCSKVRLAGAKGDDGRALTLQYLCTPAHGKCGRRMHRSDARIEPGRHGRNYWLEECCLAQGGGNGWRHEL